MPAFRLHAGSRDEPLPVQTLTEHGLKVEGPVEPGPNTDGRFPFADGFSPGRSVAVVLPTASINPENAVTHWIRRIVHIITKRGKVSILVRHVSGVPNGFKALAAFH